MKIAFYCPNKPLDHPEPSGDQTIARGIVQALNGLGHDCREAAVFRARWFWKRPGGWARAAAALVKALRLGRAWRPHLWLTYHTYYKSPDVIGPWVSRHLGIPYVLFQPMYSTKRRRDPKTRLGFYLNRTALLCCRHAITNNRNDVAALVRILPARAVSVIPPGIFPEAFPRDERAGRSLRRHLKLGDQEPVLITVARFRPGVKWESLRFLLEALAREPLKDMYFRLLLVGDGPLEDRVRAAASRYLPSRVIFTGRVARTDLYRYLSAADLFAFPGIEESLGMVYLEAQACGLPVVALRQGGVDQVVEDTRTGLLVPDPDPHVFAQAVGRLLADRDLRIRMGRHAQRFVHTRRNLHRNYRHLSRLLEAVAARSFERPGPSDAPP
ncbi:Glycosyltransferase involved in cell wall bisynthesis [Desulfacinum hydrothermale DSM 13146]|uniref:Glycosyltransferase involved in cell wall bisynthesis n=1 Tax=Desulfacinum hydrothermale DSM 13146 TaxID=1121390 RepID=A0A1W1XCZ4_9BACT|nr:glycosyltransferase family 4 protein [Desulfacinum hydrothermale]SMC21732.1 Glycosyltransferase involved in cell wall bisynthesis [Desulfacinum hydrothermale DSM 13146]